MSQPLWSAVPCYNGTQPDVSMGDIPMVKMMLSVFVFMGENDTPVYVFWGILFSDTSIMVMGCYGMLWVNMVWRPTDCGEFISIPHYEPSHSMWLGPILIDFHMIFRWFQIPNHSRMIPKTESQMPRGSQVALALAQLSGKQQAQLRELKVELCAQGGSSRHFHVEHREKQHFCSFFP